MPDRAIIRVLSLLCAVVLLANATRAAAQTRAGTAPETKSSPRDGSHDFDFEIGTWKVRNSRLVHPLSGSTEWVRFDGTSVARKVWGGRADLLELESDPPSGHSEGLILRLYNREAHQRSVTFAGADGSLGAPSIGEFVDGRGEFYGQEQVSGRTVLARSIIRDITPRSYRLEQAVSTDGGKTWETTWISEHTRADR